MADSQQIQAEDQSIISCQNAQYTALLRQNLLAQAIQKQKAQNHPKTLAFEPAKPLIPNQSMQSISDPSSQKEDTSQRHNPLADFDSRTLNLLNLAQNNNHHQGPLVILSPNTNTQTSEERDQECQNIFSFNNSERIEAYRAPSLNDSQVDTEYDEKCHFGGAADRSQMVTGAHLLTCGESDSVLMQSAIPIELRLDYQPSSGANIVRMIEKLDTNYNQKPQDNFVVECDEDIAYVSPQSNIEQSQEQFEKLKGNNQQKQGSRIQQKEQVEDSLQDLSSEPDHSLLNFANRNSKEKSHNLNQNVIEHISTDKDPFCNLHAEEKKCEILQAGASTFDYHYHPQCQQSYDQEHLNHINQNYNLDQHQECDQLHIMQQQPKNEFLCLPSLEMKRLHTINEGHSSQEEASSLSSHEHNQKNSVSSASHSSIFTKSQSVAIGLHNHSHKNSNQQIEINIPANQVYLLNQDLMKPEQEHFALLNYQNQKSTQKQLQDLLFEDSYSLPQQDQQNHDLQDQGQSKNELVRKSKNFKQNFMKHNQSSSLESQSEMFIKIAKNCDSSATIEEESTMEKDFLLYLRAPTIQTAPTVESVISENNNEEENKFQLKESTPQLVNLISIPQTQQIMQSSHERRPGSARYATTNNEQSEGSNISSQQCENFLIEGSATQKTLKTHQSCQQEDEFEDRNLNFYLNKMTSSEYIDVDIIQDWQQEKFQCNEQSSSSSVLQLDLQNQYQDASKTICLDNSEKLTNHNNFSVKNCLVQDDQSKPINCNHNLNSLGQHSLDSQQEQLLFVQNLPTRNIQKDQFLINTQSGKNKNNSSIELISNDEDDYVNLPSSKHQSSTINQFDLQYTSTSRPQCKNNQSTSGIVFPIVSCLKKKKDETPLRRKVSPVEMLKINTQLNNLTNTKANQNKILSANGLNSNVTNNYYFDNGKVGNAGNARVGIQVENSDSSMSGMLQTEMIDEGASNKANPLVTIYHTHSKQAACKTQRYRPRKNNQLLQQQQTADKVVAPLFVNAVKKENSNFLFKSKPVISNINQKDGDHPLKKTVTDSKQSSQNHRKSPQFHQSNQNRAIYQNNQTPNLLSPQDPMIQIISPETNPDGYMQVIHGILSKLQNSKSFDPKNPKKSIDMTQHEMWSLQNILINHQYLLNSSPLNQTNQTQKEEVEHLKHKNKVLHETLNAVRTELLSKSSKTGRHQHSKTSLLTQTQNLLGSALFEECSTKSIISGVNFQSNPSGMVSSDLQSFTRAVESNNSQPSALFKSKNAKSGEEHKIVCTATHKSNNNNNVVVQELQKQIKKSKSFVASNSNNNSQIASLKRNDTLKSISPKGSDQQKGSRKASILFHKSQGLQNNQESTKNWQTLSRQTSQKNVTQKNQQYKENGIPKTTIDSHQTQQKYSNCISDNVQKRVLKTLLAPSVVSQTTSKRKPNQSNLQQQNGVRKESQKILQNLNI